MKREIERGAREVAPVGGNKESLVPAVQNVFNAFRSSLLPAEECSKKSEVVSSGVGSGVLKAVNKAGGKEVKTWTEKQEDNSTNNPSRDSAVDSWEELDSDESKLVDEVSFDFSVSSNGSCRYFCCCVNVEVV